MHELWIVVSDDHAAQRQRSPIRAAVPAPQDESDGHTRIAELEAEVADLLNALPSLGITADWPAFWLTVGRCWRWTTDDVDENGRRY
jgi:hypothetical protein